MDSILNYLEDLIPSQSKHLQDNYARVNSFLCDLKNRIPSGVEDCVNLDEIERLGMAKLDINAISYYMSGAGNEFTLQRNRKMYNKILLNQKILKDVSTISLETEILGRKVGLPIGFAPSAIHKMAHEDGEIATARSANRNNLIMILSSLSSTSLEEVAKANENGIRWFQLYAMKDRSLTQKVIIEAEKNGFSAIILTVDAPIMGYRDRDFQVKFSKPERIVYQIQQKYFQGNETEPNRSSSVGQNNIQDTKSDIFNYFKNNIDSSLDWNIISWLRDQTKLPIIIKGVLNCEDALLAAENEVDGIIISNHGGRQLDSVPSTIEVLGPIVSSLQDFYKKNQNKKRLEVYLDGGIRRGTDIFKALALGAKAVFLGRPVVWGLAAGGTHGLDKTIDILKNELTVTMKLTGCVKTKEINKQCLYNKECREKAKF